MIKHYPDIDSNPDFAKISNEMLKFWQAQNIFVQSVESRPKINAAGQENEYIFFDGPPFANGLPHYGHLLTGFVKDVVARYQTMKVKRVERRFGWDCHGLPAEMAVEKEIGVSGHLQIEKYGIANFNAHCRESVLKYTGYWEDYVTQQARWVDFKNGYKTMDIGYMESVIWAFKQLYDKGLVYESMRVMPYSWACETPLSNFETRLDNSYRERADKAVTISFILKTQPKGTPDNCTNYKLLAWTTTPWTLPSNLALAVNKAIEYACVINKENDCLIIARSSLIKYKKELMLEEEKNYPIINGMALLGIQYQPLFPYFKDHPNSFVILDGEFVTEGDGTGVVHMAPGFGEDDQILCAKNGIELVCPVDNAGKFTYEINDLVGLHVFDANDRIIMKLKEQGDWIKTEQYLHNYPHCWRTDTPLIYKAVSSWYVKVTDIKEDMLRNNQQINWIPEHIKDGLFGKWLENARDWSISRNRFWGTPLPIWQSDNPQYPRIDVYGSIAEIERDFGVKVTDLHKPFVDDMVRKNPDDPTGQSTMRRVPDVFDCWFESGSMPYAQLHYPFENKEKFEKYPSADFIVEYVAQTRGWFYTLMVLSTALFNKPPFLNCICHGVILDESGQKLSKRLQNYVDPKDLFAKFGSDALRFLMMSSSVMRGQELLIDKDGQMVHDVIRLTIKPIWNAYNFFTLYANTDQIQAKLIYSSDNFNDQYILSKLGIAVQKIEQAMDRYEISDACAVLHSFVEILNNWYIRRNRNRFWKEQKDLDKQQAYNTLYTILCTLCKCAAPLLPLTLENIYLGLTVGGKLSGEASVHLTSYPDYTLFPRDNQLVENIDKVQEICTAALNIRNLENIRIRQPLAQLMIIGKNFKDLKQYFKLIEEEVNVKKVVISEDVEKYAEQKLKILFPIIGKRLPQKIKLLIEAVKNKEWKLDSNNQLLICNETLVAGEFDLVLETFNKQAVALSSQDAIVILDIKIDEDLELEGLARDVVRAVQQARKDADLQISDRIKLGISCSDHLNKAIKLHKDYICSQTLCQEIEYRLLQQYDHKSNIKIDNEDLELTIKRI